MKLELDSNEVKAILLEHARAKFPGQFNAVRGNNYEQIPGVVFEREVETTVGGGTGYTTSITKEAT